MKFPVLVSMVDAARADEFPNWEQGQPQVFPARFFQHDVAIVAPNGQITYRAAEYCATNLGAGLISQVIREEGPVRYPDLGASSYKAQIVFGSAQMAAGDDQVHYHDSEQVPYLQFFKTGDNEHDGPYTGPKIMAGTLLDYANQNSSSPKFINGAISDVVRAFIDAGLYPASSFNQDELFRQP